MNPNDKQVAGSHYAGTYQHWDYVRLALQGRYLEGNATKYVSRWRKKNGLQDLEKAKHYIEKILALFDEGVYDEPLPWDECIAEAENFCDSNGIESDERLLCVGLAHWSTRQELLSMLTTLNRLLALAQP